MHNDIVREPHRVDQVRHIYFKTSLLKGTGDVQAIALISFNRRLEALD